MEFSINATCWYCGTNKPDKNSGYKTAVYRLHEIRMWGHDTIERYHKRGVWVPRCKACKLRHKYDSEAEIALEKHKKKSGFFITFSILFFLLARLILPH